MKNIKILLLLLMFLLVHGQVPQRPHIVFVMVDDLGWNDVSFHGSKQIPTPNIDAIAKDGIILNNYYVSPSCSPSRAALMTGKHPIRLGFQHEVIKADSPWGLPLEEKLLPQYLKSLNYATYGIGKWHLGFFKEDYLPMKRGFDSFFGYWSGIEDYYTHFSDAGNMSGLDLHDNFENAWGYNGTYGTELFTDKAKKIIMQHDPSQPMFLYVGQQAPHSGNFAKPLQVPQKYVKNLWAIEDETRRIFAGMVSALDRSIGDIFEALEKSRMLDNTIFVFSTDNGGAVDGTDGARGSNWPLRGSKYNLWEGGVRAVAFVWSPFLRRFSRVHRHLMHVADWMPTLLSAVGADAITALLDIDGFNLWPSILYDVPSPRKELLHNIDPIENIEGIRIENYKLIKGSYYEGRFDGWYDKNGKLINGSVPLENVVQRKLFKSIYKKYLKRSKVARILWRKYGKHPRLTYKCLYPGCNDVLEVKCSLMPSIPFNNCQPSKAPCLFDVQSDPCEFYNIADKLPQVVKRLESALDKYRIQSKEPAGKPSDPAANPKLHGNAWMPWIK